MNIKPCLLLETKIFEFMVREGCREDGKACLVTPWLEDIYLIVGFTLLGTSFPFGQLIIHANALPLLSFCPEKNTMNTYRIIGTEKKSRCRHKCAVVFSYCFFSADHYVVEGNYNWFSQKSYYLEKWKE